MDYTKFQYAKAATVSYDEGLRSYMLNIYNYMAMALALTGIIAYLAAHSSTIMNMMASPIGLIVSLAPIGVAIAFGTRLHKMSVQTAQTLFWTYAGLLGLSLAPIFLIYTGASIARVFFISSSVFAAMSLYGYSTKRDLTQFGSFLIMGVIGLVLASVINIFLKSSGLQFAMSLIGVLIFTGMTAYDTQKMKQIYYQSNSLDAAMASKTAIMGALALYMDFVNIFIYMLQFFGDRKSN